MKAFIFNSGTGSRMGELTKSNPKALVELSNGETILGRQIRLLKKVNIKDIIISTGPFEDQIINLTKKFKGVNFHFVNNNKFQETNNIYSLYLSENYIDDDLIILHGDLVFDLSIIQKIVYDKRENLCLINTSVPLSKKDFKGRIIDNKLREISVNIFDNNCYALQPLYKLSFITIKKWFSEIHNFINDGNVKVYAENALNNILDYCNVEFIDYSYSYVEEIDNIDDLKRVNDQFRYFDYKNQEIIKSNDYIKQISKFISKNNIVNPLIVHGKHLNNDLKFTKFLNGKYKTFTAFSSNPTYEEVVKGIEFFKQHNCDALIAIGGGSCIDVAKAIKLYSIYDGDYLNKKINYVNLNFLAIPTTAGTGSESTRYAVIYYNGEKLSLSNDCLIPDTVILSKKFLSNIPDYHKKSSLLDALCQAIESYWSINSNSISKKYSKKAIKLIIDNYIDYLNNDEKSSSKIQMASNLSGRAINITQTTAPHAMSYILTSRKSISHGHAVSIMLPAILKYMIDNLKYTNDVRGYGYVKNMFKSLCKIFGVDNNNSLLNQIKNIINYFNLNKPLVDEIDLKIFSNNVNEIRLKNNPIYIDKLAFYNIYKQAFN